MTAYTPGPVLQLTPPDGGHAGLQAMAVDLWDSTSGRPMRHDWRAAPESMAPFVEQLHRLLGEKKPQLPRQVLRPVTTDAGDRRQLWAAFSGGKDVIAVALLAQQAGYDVTLYHVAGMNRSVAAPEERAAIDVAARLQLPLVIDRVAWPGTRAGFLAVPTRNQVITLLMVARMLDAGARTYSLGNATRDVRMGFLVTHGDLRSTMALFERHVQALVPDMVQRTWMRHQSEGIAILANAGLMDMVTGSCMAPQQYRAGYRAANERRYGPLLPGRCGSCGKCTWEYLVLNALGHVDMSAAFVDHCLAYLQRRMHEWTGQPLVPLDQVREAWVPSDLMAEYRGGYLPTPEPAP